MISGKAVVGVTLVLGMVLSGDLFAGTLDDFEDAVAKPRASSDYADTCGHDRDCIFAEEAGEAVVAVAASLVYGTYRGIRYVVYDWWADTEDEQPPAVPPPTEVPESEVKPSVEPEPVEDKFSGDVHAADDGVYWIEQDDVKDDVKDGNDLVHRFGTAGLPYVRFDYRWQYQNHDLDADDYLLEAGYKMFAIYGRFTQYEDRAVDEDLKIGQYYGMLRLGGTDEFYSLAAFQAGVGLGGYVIEGKRSQSGAAMTIPLMLYPTDWFGLEFRPAWASINGKTVSDYDISASAGHRFLQMRLGYRWLWVQGEGHWLNGPYAGVTAMF